MMRILRLKYFVLLFVFILIGTANANYDYTTGRWLQRDPLGYVDGMNLYEYVNDNPIIYYDSFGLRWEISRNARLWATAIVKDDPSTIGDLAGIIGLEESEFRNWLTLSSAEIQTSSGTKNLSALNSSDKICPGEYVDVPNLVIAYWGGWGGGIGKHFVDWDIDVSTLRKRGFFVLEPEDDTAADFEYRIKSFQETKKLHGIFAWGHGNYDGFVTVEDKTKDPLYYTKYDKWDPLYKMGLGIIWACNSGDGGASPNFSSKGIFQGHIGKLTPLPFHLFGPTVDKIIPAGAQGTQK